MKRKAKSIKSGKTSAPASLQVRVIGSQLMCMKELQWNDANQSRQFAIEFANASLITNSEIFKGHITVTLPKTSAVISGPTLQMIGRLLYDFSGQFIMIVYGTYDFLNNQNDVSVDASEIEYVEVRPVPPPKSKANRKTR